MSHHATEVAPWGYASLHHPCPWSVLYVTHEDQCCAKMVYLGGRRAAPGALHRPAQWAWPSFHPFWSLAAHSSSSRHSLLLLLPAAIAYTM